MATGQRRWADTFRWVSHNNGIIHAGTSDNPLRIRQYNHKMFQLYNFSDDTGTGTVRPMYIYTDMTGAGGLGGRSEFHTYSNVASGAWINSSKGYMEFGASGSTSGLASAFCAEIKLPASATTSGWYCANEIEMVCPTSWSSTAPTGMIYANTSGATKAAYDTNGYFLLIGDGPTAAAGKLLSLTEQTLRCSFGGSGSMSTRYMLFSQMEDGLGLGVSGTPMSLVTDANHSVEIHTTSADAAGFLAANRFYHTQAGNTTGGHWAMWVQNTVAAENAGSGAMYVKLDCATFDAPTGGNSALNVEMVLANCTHAGGSYHPFVIDVDCGGPALVMHGNAAIPCGFMKLEAYGTDVGEWDDHGYLFTIRGLTAADHHLVDNSATNIAFVADVLLKINIGGTEYWLGACDNEAGTA